MNGITLALAIGSVALVGCVDPLVGKWEADQSATCGKIEFEIEDNDLQGEGEYPGLDTAGQCGTCDFDIEATDKGDDEYEFEVDFKGCTVGGASSVEFDCDLEDDTLDCGDNGDFERAD